ncbi:MAG TPA: hypothetical protein VGH43_01825 [Jatrophihabitans sp.]|jgi:hypothetical protein
MAITTSHRRSTQRRAIWAAAGLVALIVFAVLVIGGYALHWRWTGLSGSVTLWDWLEVLALPVAIATAPLLLRHRHGLTHRHHTTIAVILIAFGGLVLAGYLVPWRWTGFRGNTLWDWLELVLLPLVVAATSSWWRSDWRPGRQHLAAAVVGIAVFGALIIAGYLVPMTWTGFTGNTLWDWVKLLLLPLLVPIVLVPLLGERLTDRLHTDAADNA